MKGRLILTTLAVLLAAAPVSAAVRPAGIFGDGMVLQQQGSVPIWGWADPGERVTVCFNGQEKTAEADAQGKWRIDLDSMKASSTGQNLVITAGNSVTFGDVLIGEVWVCSGQSNMARRLGPHPRQMPIDNWEQEAASATYPSIRCFTTPNDHADQPQADTSGSWRVCTPESVLQFTAVGYFFARDLHRHLDVPVGLIDSSWGGTPAEAWTSRDALQKIQPQVLSDHDRAVANYPGTVAQFESEEPRLLHEWEREVAEARIAGRPLRAKPERPQNPATSNRRPGALFHGKIAPLVPYRIRGVIWYQGEANAGRANRYADLVSGMIGDWRAQWGQGDFPFLFVQLAPFRGSNPEIREAQHLVWQHTPCTAMISTMDIGDPTDIHPTHKAPVGQRLARAARSVAYGESLEFSGPVFKSVEFPGGQAIVHFSHVGGGLVTHDDVLLGFEVAGPDGRYHPARAEIAGSTVVASSPDVPEPVAVRYAWTNAPQASLFNTEGLPASSFRSPTRTATAP